MKQWQLLLLLMIGWVAGDAQKTDYNWLMGYGSQYHNPNTFDSILGNVKMNFNDTPVQINLDLLTMNFDKTNVTISDSNGDLLFYSNGIYVANGLDEMVANGDSLNAGYVQYVWAPNMQIGGWRWVQAILSLPNAYKANQYYLVQSFADSVPGSGGADIYCAQILNTLVDMSADSGLGGVAYKNEPIINAECAFNLTATKHGNGRDWWVVTHKLSSPCYYVVLLDSMGFHIADSACLGPADSSGDGGASCFTPDGNKFIYFGAELGLEILDFDRCTGQLSNLQYVPESALSDQGFIFMTTSVSPNSRFLYVSNGRQLYQLDLWSDSLLGSLDTVASLDGWYFINPEDSNYFCTSQLGPDGKIYIGSGPIPEFNIIDSPDIKGIGCHVIQHQSIPANVWCPPNYPNYRLGSLTQSQCDTLGTLTSIQRAAKEQIIKVYPNPAIDYTIVDYGFTDWTKAQPTLQVCNALGQTTYQQTLPMYSGLQKIEVSNWAAGMYTVFIKRNGAVIATSKLVKQ